MSKKKKSTKESSEKQKAAQKRNFTLFRLKGMAMNLKLIANERMDISTTCMDARDTVMVAIAKLRNGGEE